MGKHLKDERDSKSMAYIFGGALLVSIITFLTIFNIYDDSLKKKASEDLYSLSMQNAIVSNEELKTVSYSEDKTVSSSVNEVKKAPKVQNIVSKNPIEATVSNKNENTSNKVESANETTQNNVAKEVVEELKFIAPVSGEISRDFAKDSLIYSETLKEWTTHLGIDIKADKTTIVVASENGVVESIKNDPRFGLTVVIKHSGGFKTIYSNLLTSEFVKEGEEVEKGQTIGTVGESANFEVMDAPHLHFEIYRDGEAVNPTIYLK